MRPLAESRWPYVTRDSAKSDILEFAAVHEDRGRALDANPLRRGDVVLRAFDAVAWIQAPIESPAMHSRDWLLP